MSYLEVTVSSWTNPTVFFRDFQNCDKGVMSYNDTMIGMLPSKVGSALVMIMFLLANEQTASDRFRKIANNGLNAIMV